MRKINEMVWRFGETKGKKCRDCNHYHSYGYHGRTYRKCNIYGESNSEATDWVGKWDACGMFDKEYHGVPIVKLWENSPKPHVVLDNQECLF